jgi:Meiotically up-regulated gene 113
MDRQFILDEIRRTAVDGKPLGRLRFLAQTGIKERDWSGIYWTKWSQAQIEAGFSALSLNPAYDEEYVLKCILELTRKLGKVPTTPEMQLERRTNQSFPSDRVIGRRWSRSALLERLRDFCATHHEYRDIAPNIGSKPVDAEPIETNAQSSAVPQIGYVYVIRAQGAFKIGSTRAPYRRASEIANQSANGADLVHLISTDDPEGIERYWHGRFSTKRLSGVNKQSGEWFALSAEDVRAFKKRKFM